MSYNSEYTQIHILKKRLVNSQYKQALDVILSKCASSINQAGEYREGWGQTFPTLYQKLKNASTKGKYIP